MTLETVEVIAYRAGSPKEPMRPLATYLAVGLGSGLGGICRYAVGAFFVARYGPGLPWGTFCINVSGSFLIGLVAELAQTRAMSIDPLFAFSSPPVFSADTRRFQASRTKPLRLRRTRLEAIARLCIG